MGNITNTQINTKTLLKRVTMIYSIALVLSITYSSAYAAPPEHTGNCVYKYQGDRYECCWTETDPNDPEQIEIYKCQTCWTDKGTVNCTSPYPDQRAPPTTGENIVPEVEGGIEQPPTENAPPIRSDNSVGPNDDNNAIDEQQSNSNPPLTDQRIPAGNVGILEQLEDSSNSESGDSASSDNSGLLNVVPQNP
jgi:hypothetical protein